MDTSFESMTPEQQRTLSRRAAWRWGSLVVVFLAMQVGVGVVAIVLATGDDSVAIVPDYYQKSLKWDDEVEARRASDQLKWTPVVTVPQANDLQGRRGITVRIVDADGQPVTGLKGRMRLYHHARAAEIQVLELEPLGEQAYRAMAVIDRDGLWQIEIEATREGNARFLDERTITVGKDADIVLGART